MTIARDFVSLLESKGCGVFGQNIYLFRVPNSFKTENELYWVIPSGGDIVGKNRTGEMIKAYQFLIYYRSTQAERVDTVLSELENMLNCSGCIDLPGYELVGLKTTQFPADEDLNSENFMVGLLRVQLEIYKRCN